MLQDFQTKNKIFRSKSFEVQKLSSEHLDTLAMHIALYQSHVKYTECDYDRGMVKVVWLDRLKLQPTWVSTWSDIRTKLGHK
jgi:hypothetical protein